MYDQVDLHPSQQVSDPPIIKRNLVRNIVAQFNAEAKKRNNKKKNHETVMSNEELHYSPRITSSPIYNDNDDGGQNNNIPFSYTSTLPFMYKKSKSEYDLKSPNEVIYAQVVVNGQGPNSKTTVHTKVPIYNGESNKYSTMSNGMSKNQSISTGNLQSSHQHRSSPLKSNKYVMSETTKVERSRSESPYGGLSSDKYVKRESKVNPVNPVNPAPVTSRSTRKVTEEETTMRKEAKTTKESKRSRSKDKDKERLRSKSEDSKIMFSKASPKEPVPDYNYNQNEGWEKIAYRDSSSEYKKEIKETPSIKTQNIRRRLTEEVLEPAPDYDDKYSRRQNGFDEVDHSVWQNKHLTNGGKREGQMLVGNGVTKEIIKGSTSNLKTTEYRKQEKVVTHRHRSTSSDKKSHEGKKEKDKSKKESEKRSKHSEKEMATSSSSGRQINKDQDAIDKRFYYFGANEEVIRPPRKKDKERITHAEINTSGLSSTKLVKEANAQVSGQEKYGASSKWRSTSESPTESANQDSGYFSRGGMSPTSKEKTESPEPFKERIINVAVEGRSSSNKGHYQKSSNLREEHVSTGFYNDTEERMETSESDDIPTHWVAGGSRDSQASAPSNQWSSLEEDDEDIVAAHVNTPHSLIREMDKREISYENSQQPPEKDAELLWYGKGNADTDYRREMSTGCFSSEAVRNDNHVNNNWGTSATLSRLESNKNRINNDTTMRSSTVDRRQWGSGVDKNKNNSSAVKILLNGRDVTDSDTSTRHTTGILSKTSNYASETESQHSNRSKGSKKSTGSGSPALKRVNFKTRSKAKRSVSSAANLSPIHREALMRAGSPVRPASATESLQSSGSDSNRSVILHATTVADIPPPVSYRYRIYKESSLSGSPPPPDSRKSGRTVTRTFSLLSPWKPKKYREKHEKNQQETATTTTTTTSNDHKESSSSRNHSNEHLDSLSPLPSDSGTKQRKSKKVVRTNSVPKDTTFAGFFKRKKDKNVESK